jgi:toxin ParE1/3/4
MTPEAQNDIDEHAIYIASDHADAGFRFLDSIDGAFVELITHPEIGIARRFEGSALAGLRVWPVPRFENWLIFYQISPTQLTIIRILHSSRDLRSALEE